MTLERMTTIPAQLSPIDETLANAAFTHFSYSVATSALARTKVERSLHESLHAIGIHPFTERSVARYKRKVAFMQWRKMFAVWGITVCSWLLVGKVAITLDQRYPQVAPGGGIFFVSCIAAVITLLWSMLHYEPLNWEWNLTGLGNHTAPIPGRVLRTAIQIRKALPYGVNVMVDEFRLRVHEHFEYLDPFLVVQSNGVTLYVDVWDEPTFNDEETS